MKTKILGLLTMGLLTGSVAHAAIVTSYTSRAAFDVAISGGETFDFNQPNGPVTALGSVLSINTQGGDASGYVLSDRLCGAFGGGVNCFRPVVLTFSQPARAFGYDNLDLTSDEEAVVTLSFAAGDLNQVFIFDLGGAPAFSSIFFGAIADSDISSVMIYSRTRGTQGIGERANVIDNVTVGNFTVPESGTLALLGLGLAGLGLSRRKAA